MSSSDDYVLNNTVIETYKEGKKRKKPPGSKNKDRRRSSYKSSRNNSIESIEISLQKMRKEVGKKAEESPESKKQSVAKEWMRDCWKEFPNRKWREDEEKQKKRGEGKAWRWKLGEDRNRGNERVKNKLRGL